MFKKSLTLFLVVFLFLGCSSYENLHVSESSDQLSTFNEMSEGKKAYLVLKTDKVIEAYSAQVHSDSVYWLSSYNRTPMSIETDFVKEIHYTKVKRGMLQGAGIGLLIGAGAGAGFGYFIGGNGPILSKQDDAKIVGSWGGATGFVLGIISGIDGASQDRYQIIMKRDMENEE